MTFKAFAIAVTLGVAGLTAGAASATTQLADGSFEIQAAGVGSYCYFGQDTPGGPACGAGAWTGNSGLQDEGNSPWPGAETLFGSKYGFVQVTGYIEQTFLANDSGAFSLSWLDAGRPPGVAFGDQTYNVLLNGDLLGVFSTTTGQAFTARSTGPFNLTAGSNYTLRFQGTVEYTGDVHTDVTSFIDNVQLSGPSAAPEPAAWALMILGFGSAGAMLRRRRSAATA